MSVLQILIEIILFLALTLIFLFIVKRISKSSTKLFNLEMYLPKDEVHTLTQVFYLAVMAACFINVMYTLVYLNVDTTYFALLDVTLSLFIAVTFDKSTVARKLLILLLIPYGSLSFLLFGNNLVGLLDLIHVPVFIYFIKYYYDKFMSYTLSNGLGLTIILLFSVIFISFIVTIIVENGNPLDAIVMVSNQFTSSGYTVFGNSDASKINSLILAWAGFILSGVSTAMLASAILTRKFNNKLKDYDEKFDALNDKFEELENLIKKNHDD